MRCRQLVFGEDGGGKMGAAEAAAAKVMGTVKQAEM